jgi:hypothetical protein
VSTLFQKALRALAAVGLLAVTQPVAAHGADHGPVSGAGEATHYAAHTGLRFAELSAGGRYFAAVLGGTAAPEGLGGLGFFGEVPFYRLELSPGDTRHGPGDAMVGATFALLAEEAVKAGPLVGVGLPTGSQERGLGMGHAMPMGGLWVGWTPSAFHISGQLLYVQALGSRRAAQEPGAAPELGTGQLAQVTLQHAAAPPHWHGAHGEAGAHGSLVDPTNAREVAVGAEVRRQILAHWAPVVGGAVAAPLEAEGSWRVVPQLGVAFEPEGAMSLAAMARVPVQGGVAEYELGVNLGARF